jgi:hypothetical protein
MSERCITSAAICLLGALCFPRLGGVPNLRNINVRAQVPIMTIDQLAQRTLGLKKVSVYVNDLGSRLCLTRRAIANSSLRTDAGLVTDRS